MWSSVESSRLARECTLTGEHELVFYPHPSPLSRIEYGAGSKGEGVNGSKFNLETLPWIHLSCDEQ